MKEKKETLVSSFLSAIIAMLIFVGAMGAFGMLPGQKYYFLHGDGFSQILPYAKLFVRNILEGKSLVYSFETGIGMPTVAIYAYYTLSPFNILLLIPDIEIAGVCIVCAKLMCISASMCILIRKLFRTDVAGAVMLSISYALCSFFSSFFLSYIFLDMMYLLPLIVLAVVHFVRTGKWGPLCLAYTCSFIIQFYCAYMTGIFSAVIFVSYAWYRYGKEGSLWKTAVVKYFLCVAVSVSLASPLLVPAAYELFSLYVSDAHKLDEFVLFPWSFLYGFYPGYLGQLQQTNNTAPLMYSGIPAVILSVLFFLEGSNTKRIKLLACIPMGFLVLCSFIKPLYMFMHAFDAPNFYAFRFSWMVDFCLVLIAAKELEVLGQREPLKMKIWMTGIVWVVFYFLIYGIELFLHMPEAETMSLVKGGFTAGFTIIYVIMLSGKGQGRYRNILLCSIASVELFANFLIGQAYVQDNIPARSVYETADSRARESMVRIGEAEKEDPWAFYRVRYLNSLMDNISMIYGYKGLGWFSSIENEKIRRFLNSYGYAGKTLQAYDYGSTPFMQMLLAQKYDVRYKYYTEKQGGEEVFNKNENTLTLGFMVSDDIMEYETLSGSPFEAQNALATALCGKKHSIYTSHAGMCYVEPVNMDFVQEDGKTVVNRTAGEAMATFSFEPERDGNVYAYMGRWGITSYTKAAPLIYSELDIGGMSNLSRVCMPHIIPLKKDQDGLCRLYLYMNADQVDSFDYEALYFAYEDEQEIEKVYEELSPGMIDVTDFRDDRIQARVNVTGKKNILFTSIPYNKGWKIYVDGKESDAFALLEGTFLGAELTPGEHELLIVYRQKWILVGMGCALAGIVCLITCFVIKRKKKMSKRLD